MCEVRRVCAGMCVYLCIVSTMEAFPVWYKARWEENAESLMLI